MRVPTGSSGTAERLTISRHGRALMGTASDSDTGGDDGVIVSILKGSTTVWTHAIANGEPVASYDVSTTVQSGDVIDFVMNRGAVDNSYDSTVFDPHITLQ